MVPMGRRTAYFEPRSMTGNCLFCTRVSALSPVRHSSITTPRSFCSSVRSKDRAWAQSSMMSSPLDSNPAESVGIWSM
jgi:hypothetical protein